jgi:hypothetical protein
LTFLIACAYIGITFKKQKMAERLATPSPRTHESLDHTPEVDPALVQQIDSIENNMNRPISPAAEKLQAATDRVRGFLERRAINKAHTEALWENRLHDRASQDAAYDTYANNIAYTAEKEKLIDPRSRLRKIGDSVLRLQERIGKSTPAKLLARWGIIPPIGTRHKQRGLNFSAMIARRYVKAQTARKNREARISAGFLSVEDQARLNAMDETQPVPSPEKRAQDAAYETYQENLDATANRERQEKEDQDAAYETYIDNIDTTAKRESQEAAYDSYAENIDATAKRESQEDAYASYVDNLAATAEREQAEKDAQREAFDSYAENIDATAKRELQESNYETYADNIAATEKRENQEKAYDSYAENIDATAKRESQQAAYESYESNIEATAARERREAHDRAAEAAADRNERHERRPVREHAANLKERLVRVKSRIGSSAMKLLGRAKAGLKTAAGAFRRGR